MPIIGFIGSKPEKVASLYKKFVTSITDSGVQFDQDHPLAVVCGIKHKNPESKFNNASLVYNLGAKIIFSSSPLLESDEARIKKENGDDVKIIYLQKEDSKEVVEAKLAEAVELSLKSKTATENENFATLGSPDSWSKTAKGKKLEKLAKYANHTIGVIGGAGVMTGACFCEDLAEEGQDFLMLSDCKAPDKNRACEIGGANFSPQYLQDVTTLSYLTHFLAIPCNTAHIKKKEFCGPFLEIGTNRFARLIDIGDATIAAVKKLLKPDQKKVIFFGTPATLTNPESPYNQKKLEENGIEAIKPNEDQINRLYRAIYKVKGFQNDEIIDLYRKGPNYEDYDKEMSALLAALRGEQTKSYKELQKEALDIIMQVVKEMREEYGSDIAVILGCTEFPVVFDKEEMLEQSLVSSSFALAQDCRIRNARREALNEMYGSSSEGDSLYGSPPTSSKIRRPDSAKSSSPERDPDSDIEPDNDFSLGLMLSKYKLSAVNSGSKLAVYLEFKDKDAFNGGERYNDMRMIYQVLGFTRKSDFVEKHYNTGFFTVPTDNGKIKLLENWLVKNNISIANDKDKAMSR